MLELLEVILDVENLLGFVRLVKPTREKSVLHVVVLSTSRLDNLDLRLLVKLPSFVIDSDISWVFHLLKSHLQFVEIIKGYPSFLTHYLIADTWWEFYIQGGECWFQVLPISDAGFSCGSRIEVKRWRHV